MSKLTLVFPLATIAFLLLVFAEYLTMNEKPLPAAFDNNHWCRKDSFLCLLITIVYALVAFSGLGDRTGIESFCCFREAGEYALIELPEDTSISRIRYYPGLNMGNYYLQYSEDGEEFRDISTLTQGHADLFKWKEAELPEDERSPVRFLRLISGKPLWLGELAIYDGNGRLIPPSEMGIPSGCQTLFDEQEKIPEQANYRNSSYFDEIYHARTAFEHIENVDPYEISHPPLGKLIISLGIRLFGMVPFGWRFMGTLFGVLMLPSIYLFLKKMFGGTMVPSCCTALLASDFMHFVQTRIATIDTYSVFFTILMYLFFWLYWKSDRTKRSSWLPALALSGLFFGCGAASKWTGFYSGGGLAVLWLLDRIFRGRQFYREGKGREYWRETVENILWCLLFFVLIPAIIYYLSYWPYGTSEGMHGLSMLFSKEYLHTVWSNQTYMFHYHANVNATHPYSSVWWQWLLDVRPILYYLEYFDEYTVQSSFGAWVNPVLCWGGLLAMLTMLYRSLFCRDRTALFILIGYLAQLLPWVFVTRVVFEYHYFPSTVFLLLSIGYLFRSMELKHPRYRQILLSFTAVSILLFLVFYPALTGLRIPRWYGTNFLKWMGSWPF